MAVDPLATGPVGRRNPGSIAWWPIRHFFLKARDPKATPVWAAWLVTTAISVAFAFLEARMNWSGMPVASAGQVTSTLAVFGVFS